MSNKMTRRPAHDHSYRAALRTAERRGWKLEDLLGPGQAFDFSRRFLPESLAQVDGLTFLESRERRLLNQLRARGYLVLFEQLEALILPFALDEARATLHGDEWRTRALLQLAGEEAKHLQVFRVLRGELEAGLGLHCASPALSEARAADVLARPRLAVALAVLHFEWMTQRHHLEHVVEDNTLDTRFKALLRRHWQEEEQHAEIDTLLLGELVERADARARIEALAAYRELVLELDEGLVRQAALDLETFERIRGGVLSASEQRELVACQLQALRWTFLGSGMTHTRFLGALEDFGRGARTEIADLARSFS